MLAGAYGAWCARLPFDYGFVDGVDTPSHEAGHPLFGLFGNEFLMILPNLARLRAEILRPP